MGVAFWLLVLSGPLNGSGPVGGCCSRKAGRLAVSRGFVLAGGVGCLVFGVEDTPVCWWAAAAVVVVVVGWLVGAPCACLCACGGGMLSGFWGSAPWLPDLSGAPGLLGVVGGCGWVGCELYSGREHLTVRFLRQMFLVLFVCLCCLCF